MKALYEIDRRIAARRALVFAIESCGMKNARFTMFWSKTCSSLRIKHRHRPVSCITEEDRVITPRCALKGSSNCMAVATGAGIKWMRQARLLTQSSDKSVYRHNFTVADVLDRGLKFVQLLITPPITSVHARSEVNVFPTSAAPQRRRGTTLAHAVDCGIIGGGSYVIAVGGARLAVRAR